jgi:hypothetical protein
VFTLLKISFLYVGTLLTYVSVSVDGSRRGWYVDYTNRGKPSLRGEKTINNEYPFKAIEGGLVSKDAAMSLTGSIEVVD